MALGTFTVLVVVALMMFDWTVSASAIMKERNPARLPTDLLPTRYNLTIMPYLFENNFTTAGEVWITLTCIEKTQQVVFNINDIDIDAGKLLVKDLSSDAKILVASTAHDQGLQMYTVRLQEMLIPGNTYQIRVTFVSKLNDLLQGLYRSSYVDSETNTTRWLATTQFSPTDARRAFPCLDEPAFKARFQITIGRQSHMHSLSNMPLKMSVPVIGQPGWIWDQYPETLHMSTYLVAFIVSELKGMQATGKTSDMFQFKVWSRKDVLQHTAFAASVGPRMLDFLEKYFDIPFPMPKQDMVAIPDFGFRAMENWGLITFRESAMLFEEGVTTETYKESTADVIGHELAHQWFGNLVTPLWWNDLWLKEGFATFIGNIAVDYVQPDWAKKDHFTIDKLQGVFQLDALRSSHPISVEVDHPDQIRQIFDSISYDKGAAVIGMMSHFLGEETFKAGLTTYLNTYMFSNARQDDLWAALNTQAHLNESLPDYVTVQMIMDTWTLQVGYPVIHVTRDYTRGSAQITQERFLLSGRDDEELKDTWWVPLTYTTALNQDFEETRPKLWLENVPETTIGNLPNNNWIVVNVRETGYYRVNYDKRNWKLLTQAFMELPDVTQAQLLDDALNLAAGGYLDYDIALELTSQLKDNVQYLSWSASLKNLDYIDHMLAVSSVYDNFKDFMLETLNELYDQLGFEERPTDSHIDIMNRVNVLRQACHYGHQECVLNSRSKYHQWMNQIAASPSNLISPNQKAVVYCTAIKHGGDKEWEFAWMQYQSAYLGAEREELLDALGCSQEPAVLNRYLNMIISNSSKIRKQDGARVFGSVAGNVQGHMIAFDFLRANWEELQNYYGLAFSVLSHMVGSIGTYMNNPSQLAMLEQFREENSGQLGTADRSLNQTIEKVEINVYWMESNYQEVEDWLNATQEEDNE